MCSLGKGRKSWKFLHYLVWGICGEWRKRSGERFDRQVGLVQWAGGLSSGAAHLAQQGERFGGGPGLSIGSVRMQRAPHPSFPPAKNQQKNQ